MTLREKITKSIYGYLQNISTANGFLTNAGASAVLWGAQVLQNDSVYYINLKDKKFEHKNGYSDLITYEVEVSYSGTDVYSNICKVLDDIEKALYSNQVILQTAIGDSVRIYPDVLGEIEITREKDKERGYAQFTFSVECNYSEKWKLKNNNY